MISPGTLLQNRYHVVRKIGAGGFAKIFEVDDAGTAKILKVLNLEKFEDEETKQKALFLFQQEAAVLKELNLLKVNGIPKMGDEDNYFTWADGISRYCIVMEKIPGDNLEEWLKKKEQSTDYTGNGDRLVKTASDNPKTNPRYALFSPGY